jgi:sialate O-acetylesterase
MNLKIGKMKVRLTILATIFIAINVFGAQEIPQKVVLATAIQSNMVIQQGKPFRIWGKAPKKASLFIKADWLKNEVKIISNEIGDWIGEIKVPEAKKGDFRQHKIDIIYQNDTIKLSNI